MLQFLTIAAGLLLIIILCTEECRLALQRAWLSLRRRPYLRLLAYPLAVLLVLIAAVVIIGSLITLIASVRFSYD